MKKTLLSLACAVSLGFTAGAQTYEATPFADLQTGDVVVVVDQNGKYAIPNAKATTNGSVKAVSVTLSADNNTVAADNIDAFTFTVTKSDAGLSFNSTADAANTLYCINNNNGVRVSNSTSDNVFTLSTDGYLYNAGQKRYVGVYNKQDWRCYNTVHDNIKATKIAFYKETASASTVYKPSFSPAAGEYYEAQNVEILCSTEGATIEYSFDNSTWTAYTGPVTVDKSLTLYARATKDGVTAESSAEYVIKTLDKYASIAEMMGMDLPAKGQKSETFVINFDATVVYQNGAYTYIYDGKDYALYYVNNSGFEKGNTLKAGWRAQISNYNNLYEVVPVTTPEKGNDVTTFPEPEVVEPAALTAENQAKYIKLRKVVFDAATPATVAAFNGKMGDAEVAFYNRFTLESVEAGTYDVTGFIAVYNTTVQIYVVSFDEPAEDPEPQPEPTLTLDWEQKLDANTNSTAENRFAAANPVTGEILVPNKASEKIYAISKDGIVEKYNTAGKASLKITTAIGCDTKGNVLLGLGWPSATMTKNFLLVSADGTTMTELNATTVDPSYAGGRTDFFGRILGDMMGEGALLNVYTGSNAIYGIQLAGGEIESVEKSLELPGSSYGNPVVTLPMGATYEDQVALGDEAGDLATPSYLYTRGNNTVYYDMESAEYATRTRFGSGSNPANCYGFEFFDLYGTRYYIQSTGKANYADGFVIYTLDENGDKQVVASENIDAVALTSGNYISINAYPRANGKAADIYEFVSGKYARHYVFGTDDEEEQIAPLYAAYDGQGWNPGEPVEFEYANGIYSYTFAEGTGKFKMSTTKGADANDWAGFETGVICVADDKAIEDNTGETKYALYVGGNADINFGYTEGQWTAYVDLANGLIWATNATDKPAASGNLYIVGINGGFDAVNPTEFVYDEAKNVFTVEVPAAPYGFKLSTEKGGWDKFDAAGFHTNGAIAPNVPTDLLAGSPASGANMSTTATAPYTIEVAGDYSTIKVVKAEEIIVPESLAVIGELADGKWNTTVVGALKLQDDGYTYSGEVDMAGGWFSLCEHASASADDWGGIGTRYGALVNGAEVTKEVPIAFQQGENAFNIVSFATYPISIIFTVDFKEMTVMVKQGTDGVEAVEADNAAAAEYYNLQGIRVNEPVKGQLYIVRKGAEVSKIVL